jgi:FixJ family two-component response regulator
MPGLNGLDFQASLDIHDWAIPIIFLTGKADIPMSVRAMKQGAMDFLTKPVRDDVLLAAVHVAFEKDRQDRLASQDRQDIEVRLATLTPRERDVFALVVAGRLNKQIAGDLGTVEQTIKVHRGRVMEKMRAASLADLVRMAARVGVGNAPTPPALH